MILTTEKQEKIKKSILNAIEEDNIKLPENIEIDKVYKSIYYKYENRGCRDLRFKVTIQNDKQLIIDLYFITDDYSVHKRISNDGTIMDLENFEGQFGWPVLGTKEDTEKEHFRIKEHNNKVLEILKLKGFEK